MANGFNGFSNPFGATGPGRSVLPEELTRTRAWFHELFQEAGRGLPWPYQLALSLIEQALVMGMFGGLLASALFLQEARARYAADGLLGPNGAMQSRELAALLAALEQAAVVPLPEQVLAALRLLGHAPEGRDPIEQTISVLIKPFLGQMSAANDTPWEAAWDAALGARRR